MKKLFSVVAPLLAAGLMCGADFPSTNIANGPIKAKVYLPDAKKGFYTSTRFDWSGVIADLEFQGHHYYGPWFQKIDPNVYDFGYDGADVVSAPFTAMIGPGEEYQTNGKALGFDDAKAGGTFIKIGVGVLKKPDDSKYDHSKTYEIVDGGKWNVKKGKDYITFTHELTDPNTHYGYSYTKTMRLVPGKPQLVIEHTLKNTGTRAIQTNMYNHNFLVLDHQPPGPDFSITFAHDVQARRQPNAALGEVRANQIVYHKTLENQDRMTTALVGFSEDAKDYDIRVENKKVGAGVHITGDKPLANVGYWSIKTVLAVEPYIAMSIEPGADFSWKINYEYYTLPGSAK
jgi:hypothetical protein